MSATVHHAAVSRSGSSLTASLWTGAPQAVQQHHPTRVIALADGLVAKPALHEQRTHA